MPYMSGMYASCLDATAAADTACMCRCNTYAHKLLLHMCTHIHIRIYIHAYTHTRVHAYTHILAHTYTYIRIYAQAAAKRAVQAGRKSAQQMLAEGSHDKKSAVAAAAAQASQAEAQVCMREYE